MGAISQARILAKVSVLITGLLNNLERLGLRGIDGHTVNELKVLAGEVESHEAEQEALRSRLKEKTKEANRALRDLKRRFSHARKLVKMEIPQPGWREFGIDDEK